MDKGEKIENVMTTEVISLAPDDVMEKVRDIFDHYNIHHIPVVDSRRKVVGIVSREDLFKVLHGFSLFKAQQSEIYNNAILRSLLVGEVMTSQVARLSPKDSIQTAADYFRENMFHAIPIVDENDWLVGILTTYDLINYAFREEAIDTTPR
ncbi:MAG: CBS domain-containing protein [Haliscomenobacter sp.]|nr:CBS domain-containing protein [Haliscomenobacter sp.]